MMTWKYNENQDYYENQDDNLLLVVWHGERGWEWVVYQNAQGRGVCITDSWLEWCLAHERNPRTQRKPHYTTRQGAQRACEAWVGGMKERERDNGQGET